MEASPPEQGPRTRTSRFLSEPQLAICEMEAKAIPTPEVFMRRVFPWTLPGEPRRRTISRDLLFQGPGAGHYPLLSTYYAPGVSPVL